MKQKKLPLAMNNSVLYLQSCSRIGHTQTYLVEGRTIDGKEGVRLETLILGDYIKTRAIKYTYEITAIRIENRGAEEETLIIEASRVLKSLAKSENFKLKFQARKGSETLEFTTVKNKR